MSRRMAASVGNAAARFGRAAVRPLGIRDELFGRRMGSAALLLALLAPVQAETEAQCDRAPEDRPPPEVLHAERARFPPIAVREGWHGEVQVRLFLNAEGTVDESELAQSSGFQLLDREALRVASLHRFSPAECGEQERELIFPILFMPAERPPAPLAKPAAAGG